MSTEPDCRSVGKRHDWNGPRCGVCGWTKGRDARRRALEGAARKARAAAISRIREGVAGLLIFADTVEYSDVWNDCVASALALIDTEIGAEP